MQSPHGSKDSAKSSMNKGSVKKKHARYNYNEDDNYNPGEAANLSEKAERPKRGRAPSKRPAVTEIEESQRNT